MVNSIKEDLSNQPDLEELEAEDRWDAFVNRGKTNLHVAFACSPASNEFREWLRVFPALVNCTTIDWFLTWPEKALRQVAV